MLFENKKKLIKGSWVSRGGGGQKYASLKFPALFYQHWKLWFVSSVCRYVFYFSYDEQAFFIHYFPKNTMLSIQPIAFGASDEELTSICVFPTIRHGEKTGPYVLECEVFISERTSIDTHTPSSISIHEITPLKHKAFDNTMKGATFKTNRHLISLKLTRTKLSEIFCCARTNVREKFHSYSPNWISGYTHIEENHIVASCDNLSD